MVRKSYLIFKDNLDLSRTSAVHENYGSCKATHRAVCRLRRGSTLAFLTVTRSRRAKLRSHRRGTTTGGTGSHPKQGFERPRRNTHVPQRLGMFLARRAHTNQTRPPEGAGHRESVAGVSMVVDIQCGLDNRKDVRVE